MTLRQAAIVEIGIAAEPAESLQSISGELAFALLALGIIGGLLANPRGRRRDRLRARRAVRVAPAWGDQPARDRGFYGARVAAIAAGFALSFLPIEPIRLVWSAVVNGVVAFPLMVMMMRLATSRRLMGDLQVGPAISAGGWTATALMGALLLSLLYSAI